MSGSGRGSGGATRTRAYSYDELDEILRGDGRGGWVGISAIDGLIAALVAGPAFVTPDEWLPHIFGGHMPSAVPGEPGRRAAATVLIRYDEVSRTLIERPDAYRPMFMNDAGRVIINDWTIGFMLGVGMRSNAWSRVLLSGARSILMPILVANDIGQKLLPDVSTPEKDRIRTSAHAHIAGSVIALHALCAPKRAGSKRLTKLRSSRHRN